MLAAKMSDVNNLMICGEFITSLSVANCYIGFACQQPTKTGIRRIVCGPHDISVELDEKRSDEISADENDLNDTEVHNIHRKSSNRVFSVSIPSNIRLLPNTCSSLVHSPYGWLLRLNFQQESDNVISSTSVISTSSATTGSGFSVQKFVCRACDTIILRPDANIRSRVQVADLGLPPGMEWEILNLSYFCHDHAHEEDESEDVGDNSPATVRQHTAFVPQVSEVFVADTYYVVNATNIDFSAVDVGADKNGLRCARCHHHLGVLLDQELADDREGATVAVKLSVAGVAQFGAEGFNKIFTSLLLESNKSGTRIALYAKADHMDDRLLLLWIMDKSLKTMTSRFAKNDKRVVSVGLKNVCKVLYKYSAADSPICKQWKSNPSVKLVQVSEQLIIKLASILTTSTEEMPKAWRYANGFLVGYLPEFC